MESYGTCYNSESSGALQYTAIALLVLVNVAAIFFALYQSYKARNLPTDFNESFYVTVTTFSLLESLILGGPILLLVYDNPSADFLVRSVLVTITCLTILLPMFIPKYLQRHIRAMRSNQGRPRRKPVVNVSSGNRGRHSGMSSTDGGGSGTGQYRISGTHGRSSAPTSVRSSDSRASISSIQGRSSLTGKDSFERSSVTGKSPIRRSEDYYVLRASTETPLRLRKPGDDNKGPLSNLASVASFLGRSSLPTDDQVYASSERVGTEATLSISAYDVVSPRVPSPMLKFRPPLDDIREVGSAGERSSLELEPSSMELGESPKMLPPVKEGSASEMVVSAEDGKECSNFT